MLKHTESLFLGAHSVMTSVFWRASSSVFPTIQSRTTLRVLLANTPADAAYLRLPLVRGWLPESWNSTAHHKKLSTKRAQNWALLDSCHHIEYPVTDPDFPFTEIAHSESYQAYRDIFLFECCCFFTKWDRIRSIFYISSDHCTPFFLRLLTARFNTFLMASTVDLPGLNPNCLCFKITCLWI